MDVDQFLDELTPSQFDELIALDRIEGIKTEKLQHTLAIGFATLARCLGAEVEPRQFIPGMPDQNQASPEEAANMFKAFLGAPQHGDNR